MPVVSRKGFTHGQTGYTYYGCKCDVCRAANAARSRRQKDARVVRVAEGTQEVPHGRGGYTNYDCRCPVCTEANTAECKRRREAR